MTALHGASTITARPYASVDELLAKLQQLIFGYERQVWGRRIEKGDTRFGPDADDGPLARNDES